MLFIRNNFQLIEKLGFSFKLPSNFFYWIECNIGGTRALLPITRKFQLGDDQESTAFEWLAPGIEKRLGTLVVGMTFTLMQAFPASNKPWFLTHTTILMGNFFPVYKFCPGSVAPQPTLAARVPLLCKAFVVGFLAWLRRRAKKANTKENAMQWSLEVCMSCGRANIYFCINELQTLSAPWG